MRHWTLFVLMLTLAFPRVVGAASGPPAALTPETMGEQGFSIACRFREETVKVGDEPARPTGIVQVQVIFDAAKGPAVKNMDAAALIVQEGPDAAWSVPVQWTAGPRPGTIQFSLPAALIPKASIVLSRSAENGASVAIPLQKFRPAR